jgi:pimeloyl-ACP methyl ester carboxylesterase
MARNDFALPIGRPGDRGRYWSKASTRRNLTLSEHYESVWSHLMTVEFQQGWTNAGGIRTRYVHAGSAQNPAVVLIHGIGGSWEAFCANIGPFSKHFNVFSFDNVGAGFTDKPEQPIYEMKDYVAHLRAFFGAMDIKRASIIGVSMGGWNAINFAHAYPDMVDRIILCAASGLKRDPGHTPPAAVNISSDRAKASDHPTWENISNIFTDLIHDPRKRLPDFVKVRQAVYQLPEMKESMKRILAITKTENFNKSALSDDEWREIDKTVLLVESTDDSEHFRKNTRRAHSLLRNSRIFAMSEVAHWPQFENAEVFNNEAIRFLQGN